MKTRRLICLAIGLLGLSAPAGSAEPSFPMPRMNPPRTDVAPFTYIDVGQKIPNYTPGAKWGVQGEPLSRMQQPLPAEEALKHIVVPEGFHVELFASDPDLGGKPIAMNWDERGRLWVAETYDYPNELQPPEGGRDRIRICEDTNGDGRADRFVVFVEGLSIPTSLTFARGGVIVLSSTQTLFLQDTDGDDVADRREVLFGGWSQADTHAGASNLQYGLDNWIWGVQGYNNSRLEVGGQVHQFRQGLFRFKPDGSKLEFIRSTDNNTWGLGFSEEGLVFASTANHNPSVYMPIANRHYERVRGWTPPLVLPTIAESHLFRPATDKVRQMDHFGGYTAAAGHALYTARRYPREYWNRTAFVCEPTGHLVGTFVLERKGSGFRSTNPFNLFASDDEWSAPIMAEVGPDGNVWVLDWYNFIVQHNPTPIGFKTGKGNAYETDLRDKKHGRVYRVVCDQPSDAALAAPGFSLTKATSAQLAATLRHTNLFWRRHAQRLLVERHAHDALPELLALVRDPSCDELGLNVGAIHALWTLHGLGLLEGSHHEAHATVLGALQHASPGVRRAALQVLPTDPRSTEAVLSKRLLNDADPGVQLAALLALADMPSVPAAGRALADWFQRPEAAEDRWLREAAICAAAANSDSFLAALATAQQLTPAILEVAGIVAEHRARSGPFDSLGPIAADLATLDVRLAETLVQSWSKGWPQDRPPALSPELVEQLEQLLPQLPAERQALLIRLVSTWGSERFEQHAQRVAESLLKRLQDSSLQSQARLEAAGVLLTLRPADQATLAAVLELLTPRTEPEFAKELLRNLAQSAPDDAGLPIAQRLETLTPSLRAAGMAALLNRPAWTAALLDLAEKGEFALGDLALDQKQRLTEHPDAKLRERARKLLQAGGALPNEDRRKVLEELLPITRESGDAAAGKQVFLKQCSKCHVHGGEGQRIGPDLTGMAVHPKAELLDNILDPGRSVEGNFRVYTVATTAGQVLSGILAAESKTTIELFDAEGKKQTILREDVEELVPSRKSLMPEGFEKQLSRQELIDLLEFLSQRGRYLPLPLDKVATSVSTRGMFYHGQSDAERMAFSDWSPKTFQGIPFHLVDPRGDQAPNSLVLHSSQSPLAAALPKSVSLPCNAPARAVHLLSGASGWGFPLGEKGSVSLIVRLHYADGQSEDHELRNGEHFADYIRRVDVPGSKFAYDLGGRQIRYLAVHPRRPDNIERLELIKGPDATAPVVMAITLELP